MNTHLPFACDYMEGAHPNILKRLAETNMFRTPGYGCDEFCESAKKRIMTACGLADADIFFLTGGTQTNAVVIDALLRSYEGVISADTGHVSIHEAGAIEFGGHKVLTVPHENGKLNAQKLEAFIDNFNNDANHDHMVHPGMVYISQPTEYGTLYSLDELKAISAVCRRHKLPLYLDGARLAYALACPANTADLSDIAALCDVFYIGGTKCGALFGEAVVIPKHDLIPHFFTIIKQHGALLAKGRILGIQFDELFRDDLYMHIGEAAIHAADRIRSILEKNKIELCFNSPTNQVFCILDDAFAAKLSEYVDYGIWERYDDTHSVVRFASSWATTDADADRLEEVICRLV